MSDCADTRIRGRKPRQGWPEGRQARGTAHASGMDQDSESDDRVIAFPGGTASPRRDEQVSEPGPGDVGIPGLSADQEKAIQIVLSGMSFVCIGIKPAGDGADFYTSLHGKRGELHDAGPHLDGVIQRAYERRDIRE